MHMRSVIAGLVGAMLLLGHAAFAIEDVGQAYVTPMGTFFAGDNKRNVQDGVKGATLGLGIALEDHWNLELGVQRLSLDPEPSGKSGHDTGVMLNALNLYNRGGRFSPYMLGGVGIVSNSTPGVKDTSSFQAQGGVGLMTNIWRSVALRTEALYRFENASTHVGDFILNFGLQVPIGTSTKKAAVKDSDGDGDGVLDDADKCPGTPAGAKVDANGCELDSDGDGVVDRLDKCPDTPKGAKVDADGCPADSDGDGVPDGIDQCPDTPKGATVDAVGCPKDSDEDGVYDGIDQCPNTTKGVKVDEKGCGNIIELPGVNFENDSAKLRPESSSILDGAVATLKANPGVNVEVEGHTDSKASDKYNLGLSQRRADSVRGYLIKAGIPASRLTAKGYGKDKPVADNATAEGRAKNRRVDLRITQQ
jgi:OOP family OmpA-OmpF porin